MDDASQNRLVFREAVYGIGIGWWNEVKTNILTLARVGDAVREEGLSSLQSLLPEENVEKAARVDFRDRAEELRNYRALIQPHQTDVPAHERIAQRLEDITESRFLERQRLMSSFREAASAQPGQRELTYLVDRTQSEYDFEISRIGVTAIFQVIPELRDSAPGESHEDLCDFMDRMDRATRVMSDAFRDYAATPVLRGERIAPDLIKGRMQQAFATDFAPFIG
jgi:hypothetical protein